MDLKLVAAAIVVVVILIVTFVLAFRAKHYGRRLSEYPARLSSSAGSVAAAAAGRKIVEPDELDPAVWGTSGASRAAPGVTICPQLYGSYHNGRVYAWEGGRPGKRVGEIERIDGTATVTTITWRGEAEAKNVVTVEAVSGCGTYAGSGGLEGWETGTIFGRGAPTAPKPSRFAHIFAFTRDKRGRAMWEAVAPDGMTTEACMARLERVVLTGAADPKLTVSYIVADRVLEGGVPEVVKKSAV